MIYCVKKPSCSSLYSLIDSGDNVGVSGSDFRVVETRPDRKVEIRGMNNYQISSIPLVTTGVPTTITGEVTLIMHQHAQHGKNKPIHFFPQIEHYKNTSYDYSIKFGGGQNITTLDKHKISMSILSHYPTHHYFFMPIRK